MQRVRSTRIALGVVVLLLALLWAAAAAASVLALAALADLAIALPLALRRGLATGAAIAGLVSAVVVLWRGRAVRSLSSVALWVEERVEWLRYALVTAVDPAGAGAMDRLEPVVGEAQWGAQLVIAAGRAVRWPLVLLAAALLTLALVPAGAATRVIAPRAGDSVERPAGGSGGSPFAPLAATVTPPPYSRLPERVIEDPFTIEALVGSRITIRGRGSAAGIVAEIGATRRAARAAGNAWTTALVMPAQPALLRLARGDADRLIVLQPREDAVPAVALRLPERDSVLREPRGSIALDGEASDDLGLASAGFEYIVSSGQGESFTFRSGTIGARTLDRVARVELSAVLRLDSLALSPGDVVHVRAVARDGNTLGGPRTGASETRTLRVARADEYDSLAVEGAPPPEADRSLLSQRMLIVLAERLERQRRRLERAPFVAESRRIAGDQHRLRRRVGELVFIRLEGEDPGEHAHTPDDGHDHGAPAEDLTPEELLAAAEAATAHDASEALDFAEGESPVVNINRPLLEAYNAMWGAARELEQGEPGRALPHMRAALDALQKARQAERIYLRGRPPTVVVDVDRARLQGKDTGAPGARRPRSADDAREALARRLDAAIVALAASPATALDSLVLLRVESLSGAPALAAALGDAVEALRDGREATAPLQRARRTLLGAPASADSLAPWGGGW
jgi:hypothetical protein